MQLAMVTQWHHPCEGFRYSEDDTSYEKAAAFLAGGPVEDWGGGPGYARKFFSNGYRLIDGTPGPGVDMVADLREYRSNVAGILMRHVLEHNWEWELILGNALASCSRLALVIFTPFDSFTHSIHTNAEMFVPDISFRKEDLTKMFHSPYTEESFSSGTQYGAETLFCVTI